MTLVMSLFLAACGGNNAEEPANGDTGTTNEDTTTNETTEPADEEPAGPTQGGDLIVGSTGEPTLFNPYYSTDTSSSDIEALVYDALVSSDENFNPTMALAESVDMSEDGLTYTVKIKQGVKFHDGEELNADDVVFSYGIPKSPDYVGERGSQFELVEAVNKIDDYTVEFKLSAPDITFLPIGLSYAILPEHILKDVPIGELGEHEFNKNPIGTGPFKFVEWVAGQYVKVERFDDYFQGAPYLDTITYKIIPDGNALIAQLQAGDIAFAQVPNSDISTVREWVDSKGLKIESGLSLAYTYLGYNQRNELFQDTRVRQALTMAVDRQAIVDNVLNGEGAIADVPESPISWAYNDDVKKWPYDPEQAKALLAEAGWADTDGDGILDKDGKKFSFTTKTNQGNKLREDIVVILQQQFKEIGIEMTPEIVEWSAFIEQISAPNWNYDALVLGWSLSTFPDQYDIFHSAQREEGLNFVWYSNTEADALMEKARSLLDTEEYKNTYGEIYKIIAEDQPYTFLYYPNDHYAMPANMKGYTFNAKNLFFDPHLWYLEQ
ncbi:peptide-binding protein [Bacillus sp. HMF5848]|nr:peptide-binding protein [Bacillus sp. HMF5848]